MKRQFFGQYHWLVRQQEMNGQANSGEMAPIDSNDTDFAIEVMSNEDGY